MSVSGECLSASWRKEGREVGETVLLFLPFQETFWASIYIDLDLWRHFCSPSPSELPHHSCLSKSEDRQTNYCRWSRQTSLRFPPALRQMKSGGAPCIAHVSYEEKSCCKGLESTLSLGLVQVKKFPPLSLDTQKILKRYKTKAVALIFKTTNFETETSFAFKWGSSVFLEAGTAQNGYISLSAFFCYGSVCPASGWFIMKTVLWKLRVSRELCAWLRQTISKNM